MKFKICYFVNSRLYPFIEKKVFNLKWLTIVMGTIYHCMKGFFIILYTYWLLKDRLFFSSVLYTFSTPCIWEKVFSKWFRLSRGTEVGGIICETCQISNLFLATSYLTFILFSPNTKKNSSPSTNLPNHCKPGICIVFLNKINYII